MKKFYKQIFIASFAVLLFILFLPAKTAFDVHCIKKGNDFIVPQMKSPSVDALTRLSGGLKIKTISNSEYEKTDFIQFQKFISYLESQYPVIFTHCDFDLVNKYGIVLHLKGKNNNQKPNLLTAHYDVVDIKNETNWKYPPFSGYFDEEYIYSRGTLDDKCSVFAILEALNELLNEGFTPEDDLYIAFSHTEETGSIEGAPQIIKYFKDKNIQFNTALDEGGRIVNKNGRYFAFIGTNEKGRLLTKITVYGKGSHASTPSSNSAVYKLAKLISAFSKNKPKAILTNEIKEYYKKTYISYPLYKKFLISNIDILRPIFYEQISKNQEDNARLHSTYAITVLEASTVPNAVSSDASILVDARILPSQTIEDVKNHIEKIVKKTLNNKDFKIEYLHSMNPCKSSDINSNEYKKLVKNIQNLYPNLTVAPYLTLGATDAREYAEISDNTYRFLPAVLTQEEAGLMHGDNEKISVENWARMIAFYKEFIKTR